MYYQPKKGKDPIKKPPKVVPVIKPREQTIIIKKEE